MKKLAVCLAVLALFAFTCTVFAQAKCADCVKAGLCDTHKAAVSACADCSKAKGLCAKEQKAVDACGKCKKDCKCDKCK